MVDEVGQRSALTINHAVVRYAPSSYERWHYPTPTIEWGIVECGRVEPIDLTQVGTVVNQHLDDVLPSEHYCPNKWGHTVSIRAVNVCVMSNKYLHSLNLAAHTCPMKRAPAKTRIFVVHRRLGINQELHDGGLTLVRSRPQQGGTLLPTSAMKDSVYGNAAWHKLFDSLQLTQSDCLQKFIFFMGKNDGHRVERSPSRTSIRNQSLWQSKCVENRTSPSIFGEGTVRCSHVSIKER